MWPVVRYNASILCLINLSVTDLNHQPRCSFLLSSQDAFPNILVICMLSGSWIWAIIVSQVRMLCYKNGNDETFFGVDEIWATLYTGWGLHGIQTTIFIYSRTSQGTYIRHSSHSASLLLRIPISLEYCWPCIISGYMSRHPNNMKLRVHLLIAKFKYSPVCRIQADSRNNNTTYQVVAPRAAAGMPGILTV